MLYSISLLGRNKVQHHVYTLIPHHCWVEIELRYKNFNYLKTFFYTRVNKGTRAKVLR
jgi:hypothetical protein